MADGDRRRLLTFKVDQATIEAKMLKAALLVDQLMDRLQVERYYKKMYESI